MPFVTTQPEMLGPVANLLRGIDTAMAVRNALVAAPTIGVIPAAADQVSTLIATQFAMHAATYQAVSAQAMAIRELVTNTPTTVS
jgi:PE family